MGTFSFLKTWATAPEKKPAATEVEPRLAEEGKRADALDMPSMQLPDDLIDWPLPAIALVQERLAIMEHSGGATRPDSVQRAVEDIRKQWAVETTVDPWDPGAEQLPNGRESE